MLRDCKALEEAKRWFDYSLAAFCCGTCRQQRAAPGCNNGSFSPPPHPCRPPSSQHHIPSRGHRAHLLSHIKAAPGEVRESPLEKVWQQEGVLFSCTQITSAIGHKVHKVQSCWLSEHSQHIIVSRFLREIIFGPMVDLKMWLIVWILNWSHRLRLPLQFSKEDCVLVFFADYLSATFLIMVRCHQLNT